MTCPKGFGSNLTTCHKKTQHLNDDKRIQIPYRISSIMPTILSKLLACGFKERDGQNDQMGTPQ